MSGVDDAPKSVSSPELRDTSAKEDPAAKEDTPYTKGKQISGGSYGKVYETGTDLAMKEFTDDACFGLPDDAVAEIDILKRTNHKNVLRAVDVFVGSNNAICVVVPRAESNLEDYITELRPKAPPLEMYRDALRAVNYLHTNKVVHHDIKTTNFLVFPGPVIKLCDFGLSIYLGNFESESASTVSQTKLVRPPELLKDPDCKSGYESDMWALGVMYYAMATGSYIAWSADSIKFSRLMASGWRTMPALNYIRGLPDLIGKMLNVNPVTRIRAKDAMAHPMFGAAEPEAEHPPMYELDVPHIETSPCRKAVAALVADMDNGTKTFDPYVKFQAINILDRYIRAKGEPSETPEAIAAAVLIIAAKLMKFDPFRLGRKFTRHRTNALEIDILRTLDWRPGGRTIIGEITDVGIHDLLKSHVFGNLPLAELRLLGERYVTYPTAGGKYVTLDKFVVLPTGTTAVRAGRKIEVKVIYEVAGVTSDEVWVFDPDGKALLLPPETPFDYVDEDPVGDDTDGGNKTE